MRMKRRSIAAEFWLFIKENKRWWLIPIIILFLILISIAIIGSTGEAPAMYDLY